MATYFLRPTNGNDLNDGLDFFGFGLTAATFTNATKNLNETGAFTGYTWNSGDQIYISGGTGVTTGLYEIASKTDNDNIVLVDDIGGTNPSDVTSSSGAFATIQKCFDTNVAGDLVRMCPEATETTAVQIDIDTAGGGTTTNIVYEPGNTTNGNRDMSLQYTVQASAAMTAVLHWSNRGNYRVFNLTVDGNSNATIALHNDLDGANGNHFIGCRFTGATDGIRWRGQGGLPPTNFIACEMDNNTGDGITYHTASRGNYNVYHCSVHDNGAHGVQMGLGAQQPFVIANNQIYDNGADGINLISNVISAVVFGNTIYGNTSDGIQIGSGGSHQIICWNNTFSGNGGYGVNWAGDEDSVGRFFDYNHTHNNTLGVTDRTGGLPGDNNQTGDPLFTNVADGSEDFEPTVGSPLINNALTAGNV